MSTFTLEDLWRVMHDCAGVDESVELSKDTIDTSFEELGYDSLALLQTAAKIQQEFGVTVPDEAVEEMVTPRKAVDYVNERMAETHT